MEAESSGYQMVMQTRDLHWALTLELVPVLVSVLTLLLGLYFVLVQVPAPGPGDQIVQVVWTWCSQHVALPCMIEYAACHFPICLMRLSKHGS